MMTITSIISAPIEGDLKKGEKYRFSKVKGGYELCISDGKIEPAIFSSKLHWQDFSKRKQIAKLLVEYKVCGSEDAALKQVDKIYNEIKKELKIREAFEKKESEPKEDIPANYLAILKNPNLFHGITVTELDKKIVGEVEARQTIYLNGQGRLVKNAKPASFNMMISDVSGVGKDYVIEKTLEIIPKEQWIKKTRISENVLSYWHNAKFEPNWSWDGKIFYIEDISQKTLNCDVFKVFSSSGSSATVLINQVAVEIEINGKPVQLITTAKAVPNEENLRRFPILYLDSGINQTKAVIKMRAEFAEKGVMPEYDDEVIEAQKYLKRVKVRVPFASIIAEYFCQKPELDIIMRTHFDRFLDYIKASCAFHQYQRKTDKEGYLLAEPLDYDIARIAILKTTSNPYMIPLTKDQKRILEIIANLPQTDLMQDGYSVGELEEYVNFMSDKWLRTQLDFLAEHNFLKKGSRKLDSSDRTVITYSLVLLSEITVPTWQELQDFYNSFKTTNTTITSNASKTSSFDAKFHNYKKAIEGIEAIEQGTRTADSIKIKFLKDVPEFVGSDKKDYGPFKKDEIAKLPEKEGKLLIKKGIAEPMGEPNA
jgi:hypothetical protein